MKFFILLALCLSAACAKAGKDEADRREGISYSTNVVHSDPNFPDQQAQSSIDFKIETVDTNPNTGHYHHQHQQTPKSVQEIGYYQDVGNYRYGGAPETGQYQDYQYSTAKSIPDIGQYQYSTAKSVQDVGQYQYSTPASIPDVGQYQYSTPTSIQDVGQYQYSTARSVQDVGQYQSTSMQDLGQYQYSTPLSIQDVGQYQYSTPKSIQDVGQYKNIQEVGQYKTIRDAGPSQSAVQSQGFGGYFQEYQNDFGNQWAETQTYPMQKVAPSSGYNKPTQMYPQIYNHPQFGDKTNSYGPSAQSQSFNVGYSVKFTNGNERGNKPFKAPRLASDIITGSRKEEVTKPVNEQNYSLLQETKKQKISGIKPKYQGAVGLSPSASQIISQSHITPKTQKQLAFLETIQGGSKFQKEIEQNLQGAVSSPWQSLSPSVEIYRSREVNFDHQNALGKSEGFDYSNAIDFSASNVHEFVQPAVFDKQMKQQVTMQGNKFTPPDHLYSFASLQKDNLISNSFANVPGQLGQASNQQTQKAALPKLPMDTSLLRDPVLTIEKKPLTPGGKHIPIHFDTTLIQEIGKSYGSLIDEPQTTFKLDKPQVSVDRSKPVQMNSHEIIAHHSNLQQINQHLSEQSKSSPQNYPEHYENYKNYPQPTNSDIKFGYPQNGLFNPSVQKIPSSSSSAKFPQKKPEYHRLRKPNMYMVKEPLEETPIQPHPTQFKVFSKPPNGYMRHEYEKYRSEKAVTPRQPRINPKRIIRDYNLETDLKPPPMRYSRPRRMHKHESSQRVI